MEDLSSLLLMLGYTGLTILLAVICYRWFDMAISRLEAAVAGAEFMDEDRILDERRLLPAASETTAEVAYASGEELPALPPIPEEARELFGE